MEIRKLFNTYAVIKRGKKEEKEEVMKQRLSFLLLVVGFSLLLTFGLACAATPPAVPRVTGPIPVTETSHPFLAADHLNLPQNLSAIGYKEEEYFLSGMANVYDWKEDGSTPVLATGDYTNRILVRKPVDPAKFSGTVIVDLLNATNGYDLGNTWTYSDLFTSRGDALVYVTIKPLAVLALKRFDPSRYASLSWKSPRTMPEGCKLTPDYSPDTEEGLFLDIITQVGTFLRSKDPKNPLAGYKVEYLIMQGYSQSTSNVVLYMNAGFYRRAVTEDGKPIWNGFLTDTGHSRIKPINQCAPRAEVGTPRFTLKGLAPWINITTGSCFNVFDALKPAMARPDSDTPGDQYRLYEIAGTAHGSTYTLLTALPSKADVTAAGFPTDKQPLIPVIKEPYLNDNPARDYVVKGAYVNLDKWIRQGTPPPRGERIQVENPTTIDPTVFPTRYGTAILDEFGNQKGGVRSPYIDVPVATYNSWFTSVTPLMIPSGTTVQAAVNRGWVNGSRTPPFSQEQIKNLYGTNENYVKRVWESVDKLVKERWITQADGWRIKEEAARSNIIK